MPGNKVLRLTRCGLSVLFLERQADFAKARIMYSKAPAGYEKVVGPNHPRCQSLRENFQALNTMTEKEAMKGIEESVNNSNREASRLDTERGPSKLKHYKLFRKLRLIRL
jgi:hypothetical protein